MKTYYRLILEAIVIGSVYFSFYIEDLEKNQ